MTKRVEQFFKDLAVGGTYEVESHGNVLYRKILLGMAEDHQRKCAVARFEGDYEVYSTDKEVKFFRVIG